MNKLLSLAVLLLAVVLGSPSSRAASIAATVVASCGTPPTTYTAGQSFPVTQDTTGKLCSTGSGGGGGAVTIADGADVALGATSDTATTAGGTGTVSGKLRLMTTQLGTLNTSLGTINTTLGTPFQAGGSIGNTTFAATQATGTNLHTVLDSGTLTTLTTLTGITNALPAGANILGKVGIDQTTDIITNGVEIAPTAGAAAGMAAVVSGSLETGHVLKGSAGNLYGVEVVTTTAAGYLEVFNATTVPAAGAVTPVASCYVGAFGTCALNFMPPLVMATGISVAFSASTTPFTKTDSATAFLSGQVK